MTGSCEVLCGDNFADLLIHLVDVDVGLFGHI
jgi:hypothetical protein